jgi:hypothetical protein
MDRCPPCRGAPRADAAAPDGCRWAIRASTRAGMWQPTPHGHVHGQHHHGSLLAKSVALLQTVKARGLAVTSALGHREAALTQSTRGVSENQGAHRHLLGLPFSSPAATVFRRTSGLFAQCGSFIHVQRRLGGRIRPVPLPAWAPFGDGSYTTKMMHPHENQPVDIRCWPATASSPNGSLIAIVGQRHTSCWLSHTCSAWRAGATMIRLLVRSPESSSCSDVARKP